MSQPRTSSPPTVDLKIFKLRGRDGDVFEFHGVKLGADSSEQETHVDHDGEYARKFEKCSACRWFEVSVYRRYFTESVDLRTNTDHSRIFPIDPVPADYVVHTVGGSIVPGEHRLSRISCSDSGFEVIELLTVRKAGGEPFITAQSSRALAQAASRDEDIRDAYINRAVV